ncbi:hypothetical protein ACFQY4_18710 [Catellatospora bangladeshensis]|uniref:Integrase catalytic domain-containing protein n=1 Tax=Catellatospora bangladeshensis TaxID=310355 RepID=A0A8J3JQD5_9ACTN|nr:hypothetical protein Cba03nite_33130 [Catellatospora bangladeshensis]
MSRPKLVVTADGRDVLASMGSVADCFDNALAETFFAMLKTELVYTKAWPSRHELKMERVLLHRRLLQPPPGAQPSGQPQP